MIVFTERGIKIKNAGIQKEQNERTRVDVIHNYKENQMYLFNRIRPTVNFPKTVLFRTVLGSEEIKKKVQKLPTGACLQPMQSPYCQHFHQG